MPEILDVTLECPNLAAQPLVGGLHLPELGLEHAVAGEPPIVEDAQRHGDDGRHQEGEGDEPGRGGTETTHGADGGGGRLPAPVSGGPPSLGEKGLPAARLLLRVVSELTYRSRKILYATVTEYIATGEPVGSRRLAKRYGLNLSPATIRNVLADLEDMGYLRQPHTSAGRVPTDQGFRVFVDALVQMREVSTQDRAAVLDRLRDLGPGPELLKEAGEVLSALTGAAAVFTPPRPEEEKLIQLHFMPLREGQLLAVLVTAGGAVQNRVLAGDAGDLQRVNNLLAEMLQGESRSLVEIHRALLKEMDEQRGVVEEARAVVEKAVDSSAPVEMVIEGQGRLFDRPEFLDGDKIRRFVKTFEDKERLAALLAETLSAGGVRVLIGSEANLEDVEDISVITTPYSSTGSTGSIGVIGPTRMDYGKVVPLVGFTAKVVSDKLCGAAVGDEGEEER